MFESLENRTMLSGDFNTNPPPSQSVTPMSNVIQTSVAPSQSIGESKSMGVQGATFRQTLSADASPAPGITGLSSASTVMVASSAQSR